jgi:hypothetical protein
MGRGCNDITVLKGLVSFLQAKNSWGLRNKKKKDHKPKEKPTRFPSYTGQRNSDRQTHCECETPWQNRRNFKW